ARAEQQHAFAGQTVAARAASFLIIALDVFRQVVMDDEPDVGFVDAHAECDRGAYHPHFVAQKKFLMLRTLSRGQAGVIRLGRETVFIEAVRDALGGFAALAINDSALLDSLAKEMKNLVVRFVLGQHAVGEIWPIEARHVTTWVAQLEKS